MKSLSLTMLQKICMLVFCIAFAIFIVAGGFLILSQDKEKASDSTEQVENELADEMMYYPDQIELGQAIPELILYDRDGKKTKLSEFKGTNVILLFWTSWCSYCNKEFELMPEYEELLSQYEDVEFILVNKFDGEKETQDKAEKYLQEKQITFKNYYDIDLKIYNTLGVKVIPTFLGIDKEGVLKFAHPDNIKDVDQLKAFIDYVRYGGSNATEEFITEKLTNSSGGVYVNYEESDSDGPAGHDILSESQGLMMEYAVKVKNRELFDHYLNFTLEHMLNKNALTGWMINETGEQKYKLSTVNSLIDDLRIYAALCMAQEQWGGYEDIKEQWDKAILKYNTEKNHLIDFYDFKAKQKTNRLTLCFADLKAVKQLTEEQEETSELYDNTYKLVTEGYLGDEFPLYYNWYDFEKEQYQNDDLNMAESLVTLLHLAEVGALKKETLTWLQTTVTNGGIKARYTVNGEVVKGYNYESTAIYALLVMIAEEVGDNELMTQALARMERMRINDQGSEFNGSFGLGEGKDIYSYDQCMALLAYAYIENKSDLKAVSISE
ncbi:MAG: glycosyl hydrolase family 8 [Mobilitalea sp.]